MNYKFVLLALLMATAAGAQILPVPISNLPQLSTLAGTELFPLQQSNGASGSVSSSNIAYYTLAQMNASQVASLWSGCTGPATVLGSSGVCVVPGSGSGVGNVVTTGTPTAGSLAEFTGLASITSGNLLGDCTTSGSLSVTCLKTNGVSFGNLATANAATPPAIGGTTPAAGAFTTLSASSTVSGTGFSNYLASPPGIGGTAPAAGTFNALTDTGIAGSTQCVQANTSGVLSGAGFACTTTTAPTPAEIAGNGVGGGVVNPQYAPGVIERYGTDSVPYTTSMTAAMQAAINQAKIGGGADVIVGTTGGDLIDGPLDLTTPVGATRYAVTIRGVRNLQAVTNNSPYYGTILLKHTGIAFDNTGAVGVNFENLSIGTDSTTYPKIGFLLARNSDARSNPNTRFRNVEVLGNFKIAVVYNYGIEDDEYYGSQFFNFAQDTGSKAMVFTGTNYLYGVTSSFTSILGGGVSHLISTQDHKLFGGTYYSNNGTPNLSSVVITGTAGQFSCAAAALSVGQPVTITGTLGGTGSITGYTNPTVYFISATNGSTTFTLQTAAGAALVTTAGTPTGLTYAAQTSDTIYLESVLNFRMYAPWAYTAHTGTNPGRSIIYLDTKNGPSNGITIDAMMVENQAPNQQNFVIFVGNEAAPGTVSSADLNVRGGIWSANIALMYNSAASNYFTINWFNNANQSTPNYLINDGIITGAMADSTLGFSAGSGSVNRSLQGFAYPISIQSPGDGYLSLSDPAASTNSKIWNVRSSAGSFAITTATDGNANTTTALSATRTGTAVNQWNFGGKIYAPQDTGVAQSVAGMYAGTGAPNNANGNNGDFYLRGDTPGVANQRLYVKSAGAWVGIL